MLVPFISITISTLLLFVLLAIAGLKKNIGTLLFSLLLVILLHVGWLQLDKGILITRKINPLADPYSIGQSLIYLCLFLALTWIAWFKKIRYSGRERAENFFNGIAKHIRLDTQQHNWDLDHIHILLTKYAEQLPTSTTEKNTSFVNHLDSRFKVILVVEPGNIENRFEFVTAELYDGKKCIAQFETGDIEVMWYTDEYTYEHDNS